MIMVVVGLTLLLTTTTTGDVYFHPLAPYAVSLTDATFEHETQASTGQTTGHWLIQFFPGTSGGNSDSRSNSRSEGGIVIPTGPMYAEDEWLESNVVIASVNLAKNPFLQRRFAAHLSTTSSTSSSSSSTSSETDPTTPPSSSATTTTATAAAAATWIYLHNKHGLFTKTADPVTSWQELKQFCDEASTYGDGAAIPPPLTVMAGADRGGSGTIWDYLFALFHQNTALSCLAFGMLGIRVLLWLIRTYAGENAHKRVRLHKQESIPNKKEQ